MKHKVFIFLLIFVILTVLCCAGLVSAGIYLSGKDRSFAWKTVQEGINYAASDDLMKKTAAGALAGSVLAAFICASLSKKKSDVTSGMKKQTAALNDIQEVEAVPAAMELFEEEKKKADESEYDITEDEISISEIMDSSTELPAVYSELKDDYITVDLSGIKKNEEDGKISLSDENIFSIKSPISLRRTLEKC